MVFWYIEYMSIEHQTAEAEQEHLRQKSFEISRRLRPLMKGAVQSALEGVVQKQYGSLDQEELIEALSKIDFNQHKPFMIADFKTRIEEILEGGDDQLDTICKNLQEQTFQSSEEFVELFTSQLAELLAKKYELDQYESRLREYMHQKHDVVELSRLLNYDVDDNNRLNLHVYTIFGARAELIDEFRKGMAKLADLLQHDQSLADVHTIYARSFLMKGLDKKHSLMRDFGFIATPEEVNQGEISREEVIKRFGNI